MFRSVRLAYILPLAVAVIPACAYQTIASGHRGLRFEPHGGLQREILSEGKHQLGIFCFLHDCGGIEDFDVTFSTKHAELHTTSQDHLALDLELSVIYKPIISELYELQTEIGGANYFDEVIGPEFRSAASGVFAHHMYQEIHASKEAIENEIEADVRRRTKGKHVAIESITIESIHYAPAILEANEQRLVAEQEAIRQKAAMENDALRKKLAAEQEAASRQLQIQNEAEAEELRMKKELEEKKNERAIAEEDALLEKAKAAGTVAKAHAEAEAITILAKAHADENRAQTQAISPLSVQMKAYEALGQLGGSGTTILLGDFSKVPQFLFPPGVLNGLYNAIPRTAGGAAGAGGKATK